MLQGCQFRNPVIRQLKIKVMKSLLIVTAIITSSLIATTGYSQVYVGARVGLRLPAPRVYVTGGYYAAPAVCETDFPGYAYYDYPAWNGHYRDRFYFEHYRPFFERDHRAYFHRGGFDHARFEHDRGFHRGRR
jgi:hypothetical protein